MQPLSTAQSSPNAGLFQFPLPGNYTQVGGMPMKICSLGPDSKMWCSHLGRRARERWWQVSPPSSSRDPCLGVRREGATSQPLLPGEEVLTAGHKIKPCKQGAVGWGQHKAEHWVIWACSQMCCWDSRAFKSCFEPAWSPVCSEHWKNQNTNLFFVPLDNNFLSCHALISLKSFVGCCRRGTGSVRVWLFCSFYVIRNGWSCFQSSPGHT